MKKEVLNTRPPKRKIICSLCGDTQILAVYTNVKGQRVIVQCKCKGEKNGISNGRPY